MVKNARTSWLKRAWAAAIVALMCVFALGLAACGGSSTASSAQEGSESASASEASESATSESAESESAASAESSAESSAAAGDVVSFTDSCGRVVEVPAQIDRVAVTGPTSQMCMFAFAPEKMVGLSNELSDVEKKYYGEEYASLPVYGQIYGGKGDFNKEAVASADPQLILDIGEGKKSIVEDLDEIQTATGIPCVHVEATLGSYDEAFTLLGDLLGKQDRAAELSDYCNKAYDATVKGLENVPSDQFVNVAYLLGDAGLNGMAKGSFQGTVVDMIANNVVEVENATGSGLGSEISFEQIALWDPEMIIFAPGSIFDKVADDPSWQTLTAIKTGNYYQIPGEPFNWIGSPPGINQILGMQCFARLCYPDQFDGSMEDIAKDYFKTFFNYELTDEECSKIFEKGSGE